MPSIPLIIRKRLVASTLIELIIAMIILMVVFGIALQIFLNVESYNGNRERSRALLLSNTVLNTAIATNSFVDTELEAGHLALSLHVSPYLRSRSLLLLDLLAVNKSSGIIVLHRQVLVKPQWYENK